MKENVEEWDNVDIIFSGVCFTVQSSRTLILCWIVLGAICGELVISLLFVENCYIIGVLVMTGVMTEK